AGVRYSSVSIALEGRALFGPMVDASGVGIASSYYAGSIGACGHYAALFACGRVELGSLRFEPPDGATGTPLNFLFAGLGLQIGAEWSFAEHLALNGYAEMRIATRAPIALQFPVSHRVAWSSSPASPGLGLGLVVSY
ncbi:MAG: hypothetical protein ABJE95_20490, partial [Byssovorax sp.]